MSRAGGRGRGGGGGRGGRGGGGGGGLRGNPQIDTKTALVILPGDGTTGAANSELAKFTAAIQAVRQKHDKAYERWPPHINLIFPFVPVADFQSAAKKISTALRGAKPFSIQWNGFDSFSHGKSCTVWAKPDTDAKQVQAVQALVQAVFPAHNDLSVRGEHGFQPHMTVGQWQQTSVPKAIQTLSGSVPKATIPCGYLLLLARADAEDPFHIRARVEIGGGGAVTMIALDGKETVVPVDGAKQDIKEPPPLVASPPEIAAAWASPNGTATPPVATATPTVTATAAAAPAPVATAAAPATKGAPLSYAAALKPRK